VIDGWYAITATADAALAATLRTFVRESAHRLELGDGEIDDLTLITTELLANAVEAGGSEVRLLLEIDKDGWLLRADGVGVLRDDPETTVSRADILNGLAHLTWTEGTLVVRPPLASAP
jgi:anti-sigma regulatory factor (Ser/Thr protein kinase)